jgi:hypothetical protein
MWPQSTPDVKKSQLYRIYRFVSITIEDIIHRPVFIKTQLNSIGLPYLLGNTLRLRYEPNMLTLPNKRLMRTYHWISLFMSYIKSAN